MSAIIEIMGDRARLSGGKWTSKNKSLARLLNEETIDPEPWTSEADPEEFALKRALTLFPSGGKLIEHKPPRLRKKYPEDAVL